MSLAEARFACPPCDPAAVRALERALGVSPVVAQVLVRRGHATPAAAERFLAAADRHDPSGFEGIETACDLVLSHAGRGSRIVVHGDYDVDGVCSTAVLVRALRRLGADPAWRLPSRFDGGYGLSVATVEQLRGAGADLLITVDCGITSVAEVDRARELGLDVLVTDHHRPAERLPDCPVVHPAVSGYPFHDLCAAAVAHKLAEALFARAGRDPAELAEDLDLVALATVADLVPLRGENRRLVREGLRALRRAEKPGLRALMAVTRLDPGDADEHAIGYRLAPRINAAGRIGRADAALELVLTGDPARAAAVAAELDALNAERRATEERILWAAEAAAAEQPDASALVLAGEGWHPGVIGIVASRLVERHRRPCVLIALDADGGGKGSGRSIPAFDLHGALTACSGHLRRYGGHPMAAGLEIDAAAVEAFRADLVAHADAQLRAEDLIPEERVDAVAPVAALGLGLAEELDRLGPFGHGNPRPTLLVPAARVCEVRAMGEEGAHASLVVAGGAGRARAVAFGTGAGAFARCGDDLHHVAARLEANRWNDMVEPRLVLRAVRRAEPGACELLGEPDDAAAAVVVALRELAAAAAAEGAAAAAAPLLHMPRRTLRDRRGQGFAGVAGEALAAGGRVLVVCADTARRRRSIEAAVGGLAASLGAPAGGPPAVALVSWRALAGEPRLAAEFAELIALDPPPDPQAERLLEPGTGQATLCWGESELEFALHAAAAELSLRAPVAAVYRALRDAGGPLAGAALAAAVRGEGPYPRSPGLCRRVVAVLWELGLAELALDPSGEPSCALVAGAPRTALERSPAFRAAAARLEAIRAYLHGPARRAPWTRDDDTAEPVLTAAGTQPELALAV